MKFETSLKAFSSRCQIIGFVKNLEVLVFFVRISHSIEAIIDDILNALFFSVFGNKKIKVLQQHFF
jgi:hypothetical protein